MMQTLWQDLRYGFRMLWKTPGFTAIAILSLALGIGANTALFSIVDAMLLKKLPVKEPERLVLLKSLSSANFNPGSYTGNSNRDAAGRQVRTSFPYQSYQRLHEQESLLSDVIAFGQVSLNVNADGQADVVNGQAVSGNYYQGLGIEAVAGRTFTDEDDKPSATPVAVISYRYWQRRFGGDASVIGKQINLNNIIFTIIGVTPQGFDGTMQVGSSQDVSIPIAREPQVTPERGRIRGEVWWLRLMARLKPDITLEQAKSSLEGAFRQSVIEHRTARQAVIKEQGGTPMKPLEEEDYPYLVLVSGSQGEMNARQYYAPSLYIMLGVVGLVLLVACANVANLLLARSSSRQKEIAVRLAMGASRWRLIRQLLTESVLLAGIGGALGILFALWIKDGLLAVSDWGGSGLNALNTTLDLRVLGFTFGLSMLTGLLFGIAPAWRTTKIDLTPALKDNVRNSSAASRSLLSKSLIVAQVAMSLLLLVGAGLLLRTLMNLQKVEAGFNQQNLLLFTLDPGLIGYKGERLTALYKQASERIEAVPGVQNVTFSRVPLLAQSMSSRSVFLPGASTSPDGEIQSENTHIHQVRENFLEAMEIPLLSGRRFSARDDEKAPKVAIVNQMFAKKYFGDEDPVGKRISFDSKKLGEVEIIGLARDTKYSRQRDEIPPTAYLPWLQELRGVTSVTFEVRTTGNPETAIASMRQAISEVDANLPLNNIKTQVEQAGQTLSQERLFAKLLTLFGLLAQQLASIGLYGVMAYSVSQRTREIGIRMALGAKQGDVLKMVVRQGMVLTVTGIVLGIAGTYILTKYLQSLTDMLYGVQATDPLTFAIITILLSVVALIACYIPARRAAQVDPMVALRYE
jgi:predicted permease